MNTWKVNKNSGFTLLELMIVVLIVAILVALAYPSYVQYVRKAKRGEALQLLMNWSINQEIWRSNNTSYASMGDLIVPINDHYEFTTNGTPDATTYTLQADAQDDQVYDETYDSDTSTTISCSPLTLIQSGVKSPPACWD